MQWSKEKGQTMIYKDWAAWHPTKKWCERRRSEKV